MKKGQFSSRVDKMSASIIREILKVSSKPGVISFAGGLPAPSAFPLKEFEQAVRTTLRKDGTRALQYMVTEGHTGLKKYLCAWLKKQGIQCTPDEVLLTHGSQQALELLAKLFLNKKDPILVEDPTYLGAIQCFNGHETRYVTVPIDDEGPKPADVKKVLNKQRVRFIYTVPTFQNPAGITMSLSRRKELLRVARQKSTLIVEDDPYSVLRFKGKRVPSLYSLSNGRGVIYLSTFSKLLSPGIRLGFIVAKKDIIQKLLLVKQAADLQTNSFIQYAVYHYCQRGHLTKHLPKITRTYKKSATAMMNAIRRHFPPDVRCIEPEGGMFVWCILPKKLKAADIFKAAIRKKVAFVDGSVFYANGGGKNTMRLNFSNSTEREIKTGIARLGQVIKSKLRAK